MQLNDCVQIDTNDAAEPMDTENGDKTQGAPAKEEKEEEEEKNGDEETTTGKAKKKIVCLKAHGWLEK